MVLMPEDGDQIIPLAKLGKKLRPDYAIIKHCSDNEDGGLGVDYSAYEKLYSRLKEAESYSDDEYKCVIKWSKIKDQGNNGKLSKMLRYTILSSNVWFRNGSSMWFSI